MKYLILIRLAIHQINRFHTCWKYGGKKIVGVLLNCMYFQQIITHYSQLQLNDTIKLYLLVTTVLPQASDKLNTCTPSFLPSTVIILLLESGQRYIRLVYLSIYKHMADYKPLICNQCLLQKDDALCKLSYQG